LKPCTYRCRGGRRSNGTGRLALGLIVTVTFTDPRWRSVNVMFLADWPAYPFESAIK